MTREDALLAMNGATLIGVADKLGVKVSCNKTRTALKEAKAKVIARILEAETAIATQESETEKPEEKEAEVQATQEARSEKTKSQEPAVQAARESETGKTEAKEAEVQAAQKSETGKTEAEEAKVQAVTADTVPTAEPEAQKALAATAKKKKAQKAQEPAEITAAITVLDDIFDKLNDLYFDSLLPKAVITIRRITRTYDCCAVKKGEAEGQYNIEVCASTIGKPIEEIAAGILHAMVHLYCMEMGIVETCQEGRYHNSKFKKECEDRDLDVKYDSANGFVHTTPSEIFSENLKDTGLDLGMQFIAIPTKKKGAERA